MCLYTHQWTMLFKRLIFLLVNTVGIWIPNIWLLKAYCLTTFCEWQSGVDFINMFCSKHFILCSTLNFWEAFRGLKVLHRGQIILQGAKSIYEIDPRLFFLNAIWLDFCLILKGKGSKFLRFFWMSWMAHQGFSCFF